ncbi:30S ribosomal protein S6 [Telmatocola sphagniphila]|uniref:Small ribosomal subunit protein bS6 n=1 Tax=Telmatocola sphagniphila TaxID=1123043 RepID=A0A8E6B5H4_9BACT|nr:30S ribosomal protein S6 [Telmatocola sphagniphila]QVL32505.1 30S ribosomal protein S6 [Telmatocola sphagniphila]
MPVNSYECMFILDSTKTATGMEDVKSQLHVTLEKYGAQILASRPWSEKNEGKLDSRLAYPVKGHKKGTYYLAYFKADAAKLHEIEHDFRLNETILRHMVLNVDPKWETELLAVAQDEHRSSLQSLREDANVDAALEGIDMGGMGGGRRDRDRRDKD